MKVRVLSAIVVCSFVEITIRVTLYLADFIYLLSSSKKDTTSRIILRRLDSNNNRYAHDKINPFTKV